MTDEKRDQWSDILDPDGPVQRVFGTVSERMQDTREAVWWIQQRRAEADRALDREAPYKQKLVVVKCPRCGDAIGEVIGLDGWRSDGVTVYDATILGGSWDSLDDDVPPWVEIERLRLLSDEVLGDDERLLHTKYWLSRVNPSLDRHHTPQSTYRGETVTVRDILEPVPTVAPHTHIRLFARCKRHSDARGPARCWEVSRDRLLGAIRVAREVRKTQEYVWPPPSCEFCGGDLLIGTDAYKGVDRCKRCHLHAH